MIRVLLCTPTRGGLSPHYFMGVRTLTRLVGVESTGAMEILDTWLWSEDICRTRNRFVREFLKTKADALHFVDADVRTNPAALGGMLQSDYPVVVCPYPRRDWVNWPRVVERVKNGEVDGVHPEAYAYAYSIGLREAVVQADKKGCARVDWAPLGCSLLRREALEKMVSYYGDEPLPDSVEEEAVMDATKMFIIARDMENFTVNIRALLTHVFELGRAAGHRLDYVDDRTAEATVNLFGLLTAPTQDKKRMMFGEDQSFCVRANALGIPVMMYVGPGSPVDHHGEHLYRGVPEALGITHTKKPTV